MKRYKINLNACFECSIDPISHELLQASPAMQQHYFQYTKRMMEHSQKRGANGVGKFCSMCTRECTYITEFESPSAPKVKEKPEDPGMQPI